MNRHAVARGLAWFGIGLGLAEIMETEKVAAAAGLEGREGLVRAFGMREIISGAIILSSDRPADWLWLRTAGDAADAALLASRSTPSSPAPKKALVATLAVLPVVLLDVLYTFAADALD